jgi:hypothetical protein
MSSLVSDKERVQAIKEILRSKPSNPPLKFGDLTAAQFVTWLVTLKKSNASKPGTSTYALHRAALFNLYRDFHFTMSKELETELSNHFKGLRRQVARDISNGEEEIRVGKDPLPFGLYKFMCKEMLVAQEKDYIFARCFMIFSWNLMARSSNTFGIHYNHLEWSEDSLCVYFAHMKNDQV